MSDHRDALLRLTGMLMAAPGSLERWQAFLMDLCDELFTENHEDERPSNRLGLGGGAQ